MDNSRGMNSEWKDDGLRFGNGIPDPDHPMKEQQEEESEKGCTSCKAKGLRRLLTGGAKLLKAELGVDAADEETMGSRKQACLSCEHYDFGVCNLCGCFCAAKVKLKSEECPDGRW